jgi:tRNA threonylcarbamoyladenosine biosynthesis protein TsaB
MLILATDTSSRKGSVALCRGDAESVEVLQIMPLEGGTYSARLIPAIASLLQESHIGKQDIDAFAVVSGPGSFTGLRVGLATTKGLCEVLQKPLVTVSMLEGIAVARGGGGERLTVLLDAGRGEVYVGESRIDSGGAVAESEYVTKLAEFAAKPSAVTGELITPDASVAEFLMAASAHARLVAPVQADEIARIAVRKLLAGEVADPASVDVNYIRRSDAEIFSAPRR